MKRLVIIPARGGSKRIPHKNLKDFCGLPMVCHAVKIAQETNLFNCIHVSTDSPEITAVVTDFASAPNFSRPPHLSDDHTSMMEVLKYVVEEYEKRGQYFLTVVLLYATSPLIDPADMKEACQRFEAGDKEKAYLAVTSYPAPIEHAFRIGVNNDLMPNDAGALATRTQDLSNAYYDAGMFAIYSTEHIKNSHLAGDFLKFRGFEVPSHRVTDIDWQEDWERAEVLFRAMKISTQKD